jgi:hypothetical protein
MNMLYADMFKDVSGRLTPVALIPMHSPQEALSELDFAVSELGLKAIVMNVVVRRPAPEVVKEAPHLAAYSMAPTSPGIDMGGAYDPVWAKTRAKSRAQCSSCFRRGFLSFSNRSRASQ